MISLITTLKNRANPLRWGLEGIFNQNYWGIQDRQCEILVGDGGSQDSLDDLLIEVSKRPEVFWVRKINIDRSKSIHNHIFNCPAEEYNILVKLASNEIIVKFDPEAVLIETDFLERAISNLQGKDSIIMPFPLHCYNFPYQSFQDILNRWESFAFETHIKKDNAEDTNVYYCAVFNRSSFLNLGGIDERFVSSAIGSEDDHFLKQWQRKFGKESRVTFLDCRVAHLYHSEEGNGYISREMIPYIEEGQRMAKELRKVYPNEGREWGRIYPHLEETIYKNGVEI